MKNDRVILTDCDGVLLDWELAFHQFMKEKNVGKPDLNTENYGVQHQYHISEEAKYDFIKEFNTSDRMEYLQPLRDAIHYVRELRFKHGYNFIVITSFGTDEYAQKLRIKNLAGVFGADTFIDIQFLEMGADKDEILETYSKIYPNAWWIEDKLENAVAGKRVGLKSILVEHEHNEIRSNRLIGDPIWKESANIPRYFSWRRIHDLITK